MHYLPPVTVLSPATHTDYTLHATCALSMIHSRESFFNTPDRVLVFPASNVTVPNSPRRAQP